MHIRGGHRVSKSAFKKPEVEKKRRNEPIKEFEKLVLESAMDFGLSGVAAGELIGIPSASRIKKDIITERQLQETRLSMMEEEQRRRAEDAF